MKVTIQIWNCKSFLFSVMSCTHLLFVTCSWIWSFFYRRCFTFLYTEFGIPFSKTGDFCNCSICVYATPNVGNFKRHLLTHTGKWPYPCNFCSKSFGLKQNLQTHLRIHTGEKPYQCKIGGKKFTQQNSLKSHELGHIRNNIFNSSS